MSWKRHIRSLFEIDWTEKPYFFILILLFILSRIPLLNLGFGADADAWRIANTAFDLKYSHIYHTSRFPGYPFPEYVNSLVIEHGWIATNSLTMFLSLISVIFFAKILKDLNIKNKGLLVLTYTFLPILWINSTNTMDYMWATAFIVIAWYFLIKKRYILAGLMMGFAVGSRISTVILVLPFFYIIWTGNKKIKDIIYFVIPVLLISLVLFLPLFFQYGIKFLTYYPLKMTTMELLTITGYRFFQSFGVLSVFFGLIIFILSINKLIKEIRARERYIIFLSMTILAFFLLFFIAPYNPEYLIPVIPFGIVLINKICKKQYVVILSILLLLNSFISFFVVERDNNKNLILHPINKGIIIRNIEERIEQIKFCKNLINANINHSVVIVGWYLPVLSYLDENVSYTRNQKMIGDQNNVKKGIWNFKKDVWYRYLVPLDELQDIQQKGYTVYYIKGIREYTKSVYGYDINKYNCIYLNVEGD